MWQPSLVPFLFCRGIMGTGRDAVIENWGVLLLLLNIFIADWRLLWQSGSNVFFANWDLSRLNSFPAWQVWVFFYFRIWSIVGDWWIVGRVFTLKKSAANVNTFSHIRSSNNVTPCWKRMVKGKVLVPHWELFFRHLFHVFQMNLQAFVLPCLWAELWQAKESIESKKMGVKYYLKFCSYKNLYEILAPWRCLRSVGGPQKRSIRGKKQWQWQCIHNGNLNI